MIQKEEAGRLARARGLAVMTPRLHRVDRGFDSHRAHLKNIRRSALFFAIYNPKYGRKSSRFLDSTTGIPASLNADFAVSL